MAVEITAAHLQAVRESATIEAEALVAQVRLFQSLAAQMLTNPTHPPEPQWSHADMLAQRTALRAQMTACGVALAAYAASMKTAGDNCVTDWT